MSGMIPRLQDGAMPTGARQRRATGAPDLPRVLGKGGRRRAQGARRAALGPGRPSFLVKACFRGSAALVLVGIAGKLVDSDAWAVVISAGVGLFVLGACLMSGASRGGNVGHPDINPWSV